MNSFLRVYSIFLIVLLQPNTLCAQDNSIEVPLILDRTYSQRSSSSRIDLEERSSRTLRTGTAPGEIKFLRKSISGSNEVLIKLDQNNDGELNEQYIPIEPDSTVVVPIQRTYSDDSNGRLSFKITYNRSVDSTGTVEEVFYWRPHYQVTGRFRYGACNQKIALRDLNGDGKFSSDDFKRGTSLVIDRNNDGKFWGKEEYLMGDQIIEYCGGRFTVQDMAQDGSSITFFQTKLPIPEVGEAVPNFTLKTTENNTIISSELNGKVYLLDFWASWCGPCIEKFDYLTELEKNLGGSLEIIAINVDEPSRLNQAKDVIKQYSLKWPQVMNGLATNDPVWKMFGSMKDNRLGIPLYVLVNQHGVISYAGNGGKELITLESKIHELIRN